MLWMNFDEMFWRVEYLTGNRRLDVGSDSKDLNAEPGIIKGISATAGQGKLYKFC